MALCRSTNPFPVFQSADASFFPNLKFRQDNLVLLNFLIERTAWDS
jgi:hypothetical protein